MAVLVVVASWNIVRGLQKEVLKAGSSTFISQRRQAVRLELVVEGKGEKCFLLRK
jgi:hypothetical protein